MSVTKNQHYIPKKAILKHFCMKDSSTKSFESSIVDKTVYPANIENMMSMRFIYEHDSLDTNEIEKIFSKIEKPLTDDIDELIKSLDSLSPSIRIGKNVIKMVTHILPNYIKLYYRSRALLTELGTGEKDPAEDSVIKMSNYIFDDRYIISLSESIIGNYNFSVIKSINGDLILSDQCVSTAGLSVKWNVMGYSNRSIGDKDVILMLPVSKYYYLVFWNDSSDRLFLKNRELRVLSSKELLTINKCIFRNSYFKVCGANANVIQNLLSLETKILGVSSPVKFYAQFSDGSYGGAVNKKEVFFYNSHYDVYNALISPSSYYQIDNDAPCSCGSGRKFKLCHRGIQRKASKILENMYKKNLSIGVYGNTVERPISIW